MLEDTAEQQPDDAANPANTVNPVTTTPESIDPQAHPVDMPRIRMIATELQEPNIWLIRSVAAVLGMEAVEALFERTQAIEAAGGMMTKQGDRRRTSGGVFFLLAREQMSARQRRKVFGLPPNPLNIPKQPKAKPPSPPPATPKLTPTPRPSPPSLEQAIALLRASIGIDPQRRGVAVMKTTIIGRPKQIKKLDTCTLVVLGQKAPPAMPKGLPPVPDTSKATIVIFVANKQWEKVEAALKADPADEVIIEGYPVNDPKNQLTGVWAHSCTSKNLQRAKRDAQANTR